MTGLPKIIWNEQRPDRRMAAVAVFWQDDLAFEVLVRPGASAREVSREVKKTIEGGYSGLPEGKTFRVVGLKPGVHGYACLVTLAEHR